MTGSKSYNFLESTASFDNLGSMKRTITSYISLFNALVLLMGTLACNFNHNKDIDKGLKGLTRILEKSELSAKNELVQEANNILSSQKSNFSRIDKKNRLKGVFSNTDTEKAKDWIKNNQNTINQVISNIKTGIEAEIGLINALSKKAYEERDLSTASFRYALVFYRLQYFRNNISTVIENFTPLSLIIHSHSLSEDEESLAFRKNLEKELLKMLGTSLVADQDIQKIKQTIKKLNEAETIDQKLRNNLLMADNKISETRLEKINKYKLNNSFCSQNAEDEACKRIEGHRLGLIEEFKNVTFLYTPGNKYFLITKVLTIIGNLTWGLANTLIGAGVVLVTMAVSPFTDYVDFPSFALAASGMQIYVDVTGMSPFGGKMSLGLFELDNGAGYYFASDHEAGHAIQSAILGPLYLPTVLITYALTGVHHGPMEQLADIAAEASDVWL